MQDVEIGVNWGWGSSKVIGNVTIQYSADDFLFNFKLGSLVTIGPSLSNPVPSNGAMFYDLA